MIQRKENCLAINFACPSDVVVGQPMLLDSSANLTVKAIDADASILLVGSVDVHQGSDLFATIATRFRERRDDREAAEAVSLGAYVYDASGKAVAYTKDEFVGVTGTGTGPFLVTVAAAGSCTGTEAGPVSIADAINNLLKVKVGSADPQTIALTPGAARTIAEIQNDINDVAVGFTAGVDGSGYLVLTSDAVTDALEVQAVTGDCYTTVGLTAAVYAITVAAGGTVTCTNHGALTFAAGTKVLKLHVGSGASQTVTFAEEELAASAIATAINDATDNILAEVVDTDYVKISAYATYDSLTIETSGSTALTVLGLTGGVTHAITAAAGGTHTGTEDAAQFIADAVNNKLKLLVTGGSSETVTLTVGAARTIDQIFAEINSGTTGLTASKQAVTGYLVLAADAIDSDLTVEAIVNDAHAALGLVADEYAHTEQHNQVKVTVGSGDPQTFTLTSGSRTITQIVTDFSAATGFSASASTGHLRLATDDLADALIIGTVSGDAYDLLGLTAGTYDEIWSHNPASIAGLIIKLPDPCAVIGTVSGLFDIANGVNDALSIVIGAGESQVFDLTTADGQTANDICDKINDTATDFTAVRAPGGYVKLLVDAPFNDIEIEEVANSAYATLGFTPAVTAAPMIINTLEK